MLYGALVLAMTIGTIQGQANDNSPFAWISVSTALDGKQGNIDVFISKESAVSIEGDSAGAKEEWNEFYCLFNGGLRVSSLRLCVIAELQILQGEKGEKGISFFGKAIFSVDEGKDVIRVNTYTYAIESHKS